MKIDDIEGPAMRKAVAIMQNDFWSACTAEAARAHPNWEVTGPGRMKWLGGRRGPRTPRTLLNWFLEAHPDACERIAARINARAAFQKAAPPEGARLQ